MTGVILAQVSTMLETNNPLWIGHLNCLKVLVGPLCESLKTPEMD